MTNRRNQVSNDQFLFHTKEYLDICLSAYDNVVTYQSNADDLYQIQFRLDAGAAFSPVSASFGGLTKLPTKLRRSDLSSFFSEFEFDLMNKGAHEVVIRTFPEVYDAAAAWLEAELLIDQGYSRSVVDITQFLHISNDSFQSQIKVSERQKLRRAGREMTGEKLSNDHLPEVYSLIKKNRHWKKYPMTTSLDWLSTLFSRFPDQYLLFGVFDKELVASAVAVRISPNILYTFYVGDVPRTRTLSPVVLLLELIYNYARDHSYRILDLGVSTEKGIVNPGLYHFKKSLGARDSNRVTWRKLLK